LLDYNEDAFNATTIFSVVTIAVATLFAIFHITAVYLPSLPRGRRSIGPLNGLVLAYLISTFFATFTFSVMSAGRIWAAFGVFHNLFEIALFSNLVFRQKSLL
jgi:drug/metabolite transporter superfamily protein YnfA